MKSLVQLMAFAFVVSFSLPASAGPYDDVPNAAACKERGAVWDFEAGKCVATKRKTLCGQRGGVWDAGTGTCSVPKQ
jgi:hypothetical protein